MKRIFFALAVSMSIAAPAPGQWVTSRLLSSRPQATQRVAPDRALKDLMALLLIRNHLQGSGEIDEHEALRLMLLLHLLQNPHAVGTK